LIDEIDAARATSWDDDLAEGGSELDVVEFDARRASRQFDWAVGK
jgi:hypothetical protein